MQVANPAHVTKFVWKLSDLVIVKPGRKYSPDQPRVPAGQPGGGQFGSGDGAATATAEKWTADGVPKTPAEFAATYTEGFNRLNREVKDHGGSLVTDDPKIAFDAQGMGNGHPDQVPADERARCEKIAEDFMNSEQMQPFFDAYGRPEILIANAVCTSDPAKAGADPADAGILAQWSFGSVILYGDTTGMSPEEMKTYGASMEPGYNASGLDTGLSMIHEYGHQIMNEVGWVDDPNDPNNMISSPMRQSFVESLLQFSPQDADQHSREETITTLGMTAGQVSTYAAEGGPDEAFSEFFTELMTPGFDIDNYDDGAQDAFRAIQDQLDKDVPSWRQMPGQGTLA